jgi:hypothetical protein
LHCPEIDYAGKPPVYQRQTWQRNRRGPFQPCKGRTQARGKEEFKTLAKGQIAYVRELFDRMEEIRFIQKRLWKLMEDNPDKPILQKSCLSELHQSTITLCNLYDVLPAAIAVRPDFVNGGYGGGKYDTTSHFESSQTRE